MADKEELRKAVQSEFVAAEKAAEPVAEPEPEAPAPEEGSKLSSQDRLEKLRSDFETVPLRINHEDVEFATDEVLNLAQKGWKAGDLERKAEELSADVNGFGAFKQWQQWLVSNPERANEIRDIYEGRVPDRFRQQAAPAENDSYEYQYLPEESGAPTRPPAMNSEISGLQSRIQQLEDMVSKTSHQVQRRDFEGQLDESILRQPFLASNPDAQEMAKGLIAALVSNGEYRSPQEAAPVVATRLQRMVEAEMDGIRRKREQQHQTAAPPSGSGTPFVPSPIDPEEKITPGPKGLRDGTAKTAIRDWMMSAMKQRTSGG